ncbi:pentapeptide repeat-containing protein, partial [Couchioplanes azureus]
GFTAAAGAAAALLLAVRRQLLSEHTHDLELRKHEHTQAAQAHTERDAAERRVTDLYTKAAEQLGHPEAAVRLAGLYALERVAQSNPYQRQTIVNVLCAYLRMPYSPPVVVESQTAPPPLTDLPLTPSKPSAAARDPHQELQVRLTAQRILTTHLKPPSDTVTDPGSASSLRGDLYFGGAILKPDPDQLFWPGIDLDLTGAVLVDWNFVRCHLLYAIFNKATFIGDADFHQATFLRDAYFWEATFTGSAYFLETTFTGSAEFQEATFTGRAGFSRATFADGASFHRAAFTRGANFRKADFTGDANFHKATFD